MVGEQFEKLRKLPKYIEWINSRPISVQEMSRKYPLGKYTDREGDFFVVGYAEYADGTCGLCINEKEFSEEVTARICPNCILGLKQLE